MHRFFRQAIFTLIVATFLVPTVVIPSSFIFPFIVPKIVVFRSLAAALVALFVLLALSDRARYRLQSSPVTWAVLAFGASFAISTFFGTDAYHSFWDNHERMLGLFTILHYVLYYVVVTTFVQTAHEWKWLLRGFLAAGSIVTTIGLLQVVNPDLLLNQGNARVSSTLGNAIYLGGYGLFLITVSVVLWFKDKGNSVWRAIYVVAALIAFGAMFNSGTRGSFVGLATGLGTALILTTILFRKTHVKIARASGVVVLVGFALLIVGYIFRQTTFVRSIPMVGYILNSSLSSGTGSTRLIAWQIAVQSWKAHPIVGWGPNNFFYAFNQYYNPQSLRFGFGETWFDNAHNILLNTLTVQGVLGVAAYLAMFGCAAYMLLRNKSLRDKSPELVIIGVAYLAAHLVENLTVFENPTSYLFFMFWLAFVNAESIRLSAPPVAAANATPPVKKPIASPAKRFVSSWAVGSVFIFTIGWIYVFNIDPANANMDTLRVLNTLATNPAAAVAEIHDVLNSRSPHIDDIRGDIARQVVSLLTSQQNIPTDLAKALINEVYPAMQENISLHPFDIRNQLTIAQLGQLAFMATKNGNYVLDAEKYLSDALKFSPQRQQLIYSLAGIKAQLGKNDEAIQLLDSSIEAAPNIGENYWRLAMLYQYFGNYKKAKSTLDLAHANGVSFDDQALQMEAQITAALRATSTKK